MKNKKTYYQIILDNSGSMKDVVKSTIEGYNKQMNTIKQLKEKYSDQEFSVSLTTFNEQVKLEFERQNPNELKLLKDETNWWSSDKNRILYNPNGLTALYDAIGISVKNIMDHARDEINENMASVIVLIITDGHENSSKQYSYEDIQSMIGELEESKNWTFTYLSNTPDAVDYAKRMNIKERNAKMYSKRNMMEEWNKVSYSMDSYVEKKLKNEIDDDFLIH
jgi:hypothetical protein